MVAAAHYYQLGADQNDAQAQFNYMYAICLSHGKGVRADLANAAIY
jgi:TPR repeat protein